MTDKLSLVQLVLEASWVVQLVMALLLAASVLSWAIILHKTRQLKQAEQRNSAFEQEFWSGRSLQELYASVVGQLKLAGPLERVFVHGMREWQKLRERRSAEGVSATDSARRAMHAGLQRECDALEGQMDTLASIASVSPYVGLFGTVWGIMETFTKFGAQQQVTLATVAPSIAEALIATAFGLLAAIPAVLAYNRLSRRAEGIAVQMESFTDEFLNILQRNA